MAEKITDEQLRKQLIAFGDKNIGAVTDSTRPIYLKKLNHLKARQKQSANSRNSKKLLGFSSDESDTELAAPAPGPSTKSAGGRRRQTTTTTTTTTRRGRSAAQTSQSQTDTTDTSPGVRKSNRLSLSRPSLRSRSNATSAPANEASSSSSRRGPANFYKSTLEESSKNSPSYSHYSDSIGLQTSLAEDSQDSEPDFGSLDIPESFANSDSDLDLSKVPSFSSQSPERVNKSINTSFGLDDTTFASEASGYLGGTPSTSYFGSFSPNSGARATRGSLDSAGDARRKLVSHVATNRRNHNATQGFNESDSWSCRIAHHVSMFLVILFVLFFLCIGVMYWNMAAVTTSENETGTAVATLGLCSASETPVKNGCVPKERLNRNMKIIQEIGAFLDNQASQAECGYMEGGKNVTVDEVKDNLLLRRSDDFDEVLHLIEKNKQWQIKLLDKSGEETTHGEVAYLESGVLTLPLFCRLSRALTKVLNILAVLVVVAICLSLGLALLRWYWKRQEEETKKVYDIVENIIDILRSHSEESQSNPELQPYLAIPHVRDMLIPPKERRRMQTLWDKAVKFLSANESRVRVEVKTIHGEEFAVWRWLQTCPNGSKVWQGQAFGESKDSSSPNSPRYSPSPCLKIRNMFDLDVEYGDDWHVYIQDAILEKCGPNHRILHIAVDKSSKEGCVYVKCADEQASGVAYKALHGWWFDGNLVTVKYLRLERYHARFPDTSGLTTYLSPSNNQQKSLSQPFHHSIMEAS